MSVPPQLSGLAAAVTRQADRAVVSGEGRSAPRQMQPARITGGGDGRYTVQALRDDGTLGTAHPLVTVFGNSAVSIGQDVWLVWTRSGVPFILPAAPPDSEITERAKIGTGYLPFYE